MKAIDKYAYVASLNEDKRKRLQSKHSTRYVDTFEEEEPVDLDAVVKDLKVVEIDMQKTDKTITKFCKELEDRKSVLIAKIQVHGRQHRKQRHPLLRFKDEQGND